MPQRVVFTDPTTGRFISETTAARLESSLRSVFEGGLLVQQQVLEFGAPAEEVAGQLQNWQPKDTPWGQRWYANDEPLDMFGLQNTDFPERFDSFRITYHVDPYDENDSGYASTHWLTPDKWPPDLEQLERGNPTGISLIVFRNQ